MKNRNPAFRALALAQGALTPTPVLPWYSGQTGGSPSYGWRHDALLTPDNVGAWIQCYAARPAYYDDAPARHSAYEIGCRPLGWNPETPDDALGGQWIGPAPDHVAVSGPDLEHFPLSPLLAIADSEGLKVKREGWLGALVDQQGAAPVARTMLRYLSSAHAGMLRQSNGALISYVCTDRPASYILRTLTQCGKRGLMATADIAIMRAYIELRLLPRWEASPDETSTAKGSDLQTYNQLFWVVPALYDYLSAEPAGAYRRRLFAALQRLSARVNKLQLVVPGKAAQVTHVATWKNMTAADVTVEPSFGAWGVRALDVAGVALGITQLREAAAEQVAKCSASDKAWLVSADGGYA